MLPSLSTLFESAADTHFLHSQAYVEGVIVAACACPEIPLPDTWLPWTIKMHGQVKDNTQADRIFEQLFNYFRDVLSAMKQNQMMLPAYINSDDLFENECMHDFFTGLLFAHQATEGTWQHAWSKMAEREPEQMQAHAKKLKHCLMMFSTFAAPAKALQKAEKSGNDAFVEKLPLIAKSLPEAFTKYVSLSNALIEYLPDQFETFQQNKPDTKKV